MENRTLSSSEPLLLAVSRKLVLLLLLMLTSSLGWVAMLLQARLKIPLLSFFLTDAVFGLLAGFSVRWVIPKKARITRLVSAIAYITGALALLGWFTGWSYGIDLLSPGPARGHWWDFGQVLLATGFAFLAVYAWSRPVKTTTDTPVSASEVRPRPRKKRQKRTAIPTKALLAAPEISQAAQPGPQTVVAQTAGNKRPRRSHSKPRLVLSAQQEHRCPYCLELVDPDDKRGVVECEICHTLHHADCWAITGACQVPHFTA